MTARPGLQWSDGAAGPVLAVAKRRDWRALAACRGVDPERFFPDAMDGAGIAAAKAVCAGCPVRAECLSAAMNASPAVAGIWGGELFSDRGQLIRASVPAVRAPGRVVIRRPHLTGPNSALQCPGKCRNDHTRTAANTRREAPSPAYPYGKTVCTDCTAARGAKRKGQRAATEVAA
jgi:WhiB family redox-sensing transcriptional regulator